MSMVRSPRPVGRPPRESSPSQAQLPSRQPIPSPELITRRQTAAILSCSVATVVRLRRLDGSRLSGSTQAQMDQSGIGWIRSASLPGGENG